MEAALRTERVIEVLDQHHRDIAVLLAEAEDALRASAHNRTMQLSLIRWRLVRTLRLYQLLKHGKLFDPLIASGTATQAAPAREMKEQCVRIGQRFEDHVRRWSSGRIEVEWPSYERETTELIAHLRGHLAAERSGLIALLRIVDRARDTSGTAFAGLPAQ